MRERYCRWCHIQEDNSLNEHKTVIVFYGDIGKAVLSISPLQGLDGGEEAAYASLIVLGNGQDGRMGMGFISKVAYAGETEF